MAQRSIDFELRISVASSSRYEALLLNRTERREITVLFEAPFGQTDLQALQAFGEAIPLGERQQWDEAERFGRRLFEVLFAGEMLSAWRLATSQARTEGASVRLLLHLVPIELRILPWELLYDPQYDFFLALDPQITIVRYPEQPEALPAITAQRPLRILGVISNPVDTAQLNTAEEKQTLEQALAPLIQRGLVELHWLERPTFAALLDRLATAQQARTPMHVFHYIGHAGFGISSQRGVLLLEQANRLSEPIDSARFGTQLAQRGVVLAVLNACESSRAAEADPFRSLALALVARANIPAVIANQFAISDRAALALSGRFYAELTAGATVEAALGAARRAVADAVEAPEWATTVFFSRLPTPLNLGLAPRDWLDAALVRLPFFWAALTALFGLLALIIVISTLRQAGWAVGAALGLALALPALWLGYDRRDKLRQRFPLASGAATLGLLLGGAWFLWNPSVTVPLPPPDFRITIEEPPPLFTRLEEIKGVRFSTTVRGRVENMPPDRTLWLLVQAENSATYAAGERASVQADGTFLASEVVVGPITPRQLGGRFYTIQPVLADAAADAFFAQQTSDFWRFFHPDLLVVPEPRLPNTLVVRR